MQRGDLAQGQAARRAPGQELPRRPRVGRARPGVGDGGREELEETLDGRRAGVDDHRGQRHGRAGPGDRGPADLRKANTPVVTSAHAARLGCLREGAKSYAKRFALPVGRLICSHPSGEMWARNSAGISSPTFLLAKTASPSFSVFQ